MLSSIGMPFSLDMLVEFLSILSILCMHIPARHSTMSIRHFYSESDFSYRKRNKRFPSSLLLALYAKTRRVVFDQWL